jgi:molecular chaperone HtpG
MPVFRSQLPESTNFIVMFEGLGETGNPVTITQSEFMRRMKDMSALGGGMNFYGELPDSYNLVVNGNHPLVLKVNKDLEKELTEEIKKIDEKIKPIEANKADIETANKDKKEEEIKQADKDRIEKLDKKIDELKKKKEELLTNYGKDNNLVKQMTDLALLANNMLKGEDLAKFVKRSIELL